MSFPYTPSPVALSTITLPNDGDLRAVASVNNPMARLADAIKYLVTHNVILATAVDVTGGTTLGVDVTGTFVAPSDCVAAIVSGWGSGGGGGGGGNDCYNFKATTGGSGGAGARHIVDVVPIVGGESYSYLAPRPADAEQSGNSAILTRVSTSAQIFVARGGGCGRRGAAVDRTEFYVSALPNTCSTRDLFAGTRGGVSVQTPNNPVADISAIIRSAISGNFPPAQPQDGGLGMNWFLNSGGDRFVGDGGYSPEGFAGGTRGISGNDYSTLYKGGGGGGGGGAGPGGNGGNGGAGSNAADIVSNLLPASPGGNAGDGSGAGGGGGGGVGESNGTSPGVAGGLGGKSGSGHIRVWLLRAA